MIKEQVAEQKRKDKAALTATANKLSAEAQLITANGLLGTASLLPQVFRCTNYTTMPVHDDTDKLGGADWSKPFVLKACAASKAFMSSGKTLKLLARLGGSYKKDAAFLSSGKYASPTEAKKGAEESLASGVLS
jgi:hypothetical protein